MGVSRRRQGRDPSAGRAHAALQPIATCLRRVFRTENGVGLNGCTVSLGASKTPKAFRRRNFSLRPAYLIDVRKKLGPGEHF